jgi:glucuronoarabinoxylan endo-1,4-beta-xylanase
MKHLDFSGFALCFSLFVALTGCEPPAPGPQGDSHTNWLRTCERDNECSTGLSCVCGMCTARCSSDDACTSAPGSSCVRADAASTVAVCGGQAPPAAGMCLPTCEAPRDCADGQDCLAGACRPLAAPTSHVSVDTGSRLQMLTGFGATVGYAEDDITTAADPDALAEAMFSGLGLDVLRFRNRYTEDGEAPLHQAAAIVAAAELSLGRAPLVLLSSWSPPASLKQNGATFCSDPTTCKLAKDATGAFDYAGLAAYWRSSLDAYAREGFVPDYVGIQNNADWTPSGGAVMEACKFLPREGTTNVMIGGAPVAVHYPGYDQALTAVMTALADLPTRPRILAPDLSSIVGAKEYLSVLAPAQVDAVSHHLYGSDAADLDLAGLQALATLGSDMSLPLFQTEMQADGFDTALLIHHAVAEGNASMYLQAALVGARSGPVTNRSALIGMDGKDIVLQEPYFAMSHFSRFTDPGWSRVAAETSTPGLLASAWLSPAHDALTIVLVNAGGHALTVDLDLGAEQVRSAQLRRTVFDGSERFADLGGWTVTSTISLPPRSIATVVIEE